MSIRDAIGWIRLRQDPREAARASVEAVNGRNWEQLRGLLDDGFFYLDGDNNRIDSPDRFVASLRGLMRAAPDFRLEVDSFEDAGHMVYMRGRTVSDDFRFRSNSMWRAEVRRGRLASLENFRTGAHIRLDEYAPADHA